MKHLRIILGLTLIPLCAFLGSFVPIAGGNGMIIGFFLGIAFSCLFLTYGPGHRKSQLPTASYLNHDHQANSGVNQQAIEIKTVSIREAAVFPPWYHPMQ